LANLSDWPTQKVEALRRVLRDEPLAAPEDAFAIERSWPHGHVEAVLQTIGHIGLDKLIGTKRTRERDLVLAMIVERLIAPCSKLATTRMWHSTTLAQLLAVEDADEEELYAAMDWLLEHQGRIEKRLAARHLGEGQQVLYDVSSSYYEGHTCPLVRFGHSRDGKRGKPIVVYGVLSDVPGRPVAVQVYPGNTGDPSTVADQVEKLKGRFGLERVVLVGDRGMLTQTQIEVLKTHPGIGWISALRSEKVRTLVEEKHLQLSLFDERNLAEIYSKDFPDERLVACFNPLLAEERRRKRNELLDATENLLEKIRSEVQRRTKTPLSAAQIERAFLPKPQQRHRPDPLPVTLLGQLAVDKAYQGQGHAASLLLFALKTALRASQHIGSLGVITHPLDDDVRRFYARWGFQDLPYDPRRAMLVRMVDLQQSFVDSAEDAKKETWASYYPCTT